MNGVFTDVDKQAQALNRLEMDNSKVATVGAYAEELRLRIAEDERSTVLDYIAEQKMAVVTIDIVKPVINELPGWDRFEEPGTGKEAGFAGLSF